MGSITPATGRRLFGEPRVDQVGDGVYVARAFDLGNVIKIETREGPVVIDTAGANGSAAAARDALAQASPGDARFVVYTHSHSDHTSGAEALTATQTKEVVAHESVPAIIERDHGCLGAWTARHRAHQRGRPFDEPFDDRGYVAPTLTFRDALDLDVGGLTFHFEHTEGETRDHLLVWIPETRVLFPGDLVYPAFPNLSTPAIGPRPIAGWIRALDRFRELGAEHLVPSHGPPVSGADTVAELLTVYRDAIQYVWDESVRAIDAGRRGTRRGAVDPVARPLGRASVATRGVRDRWMGRARRLRPAHRLVRPLAREPRSASARARTPGDPRHCCCRPPRRTRRAGARARRPAARARAHRRRPRRRPEPCRREHRAGRRVLVLRDHSTSINQRGFYHSGLVRARARLTGTDIPTPPAQA